MRSRRSAKFQRFLTCAETAIRHGSPLHERVHGAAERMFTALQTPSGQAGRPDAACLPDCRHLDCRHLATALEEVRSQPGAVGALGDAFADIEPQLRWQVRAGSETPGEQDRSGYASAIIAGPEGLEIRPDVRIGVSLLAPHTQYPDHRHPPEEVYVVLSGGQWRQASDPWHEPGIGGLVYNPPNIVHAMRAMERPLLALWFLWTGQNSP